MPTASLSMPFAPLLDENTLRALRQHGVVLGRGVCFCASSMAIAMMLWLILAGPGFLTDGASTAVPRGRVTAQR